MNTDINRITEKIIGCAFRVANTPGCGFLENVYENALVVDLRHAGLSVKAQYPMQVRYRGEIVGEYVADLLVEDVVLVELKAVSALDSIHQAQCINYLKATGIAVYLLINFGGKRLEIKRLMGPGAYESETTDLSV